MKSGGNLATMGGKWTERAKFGGNYKFVVDDYKKGHQKFRLMEIENKFWSLRNFLEIGGKFETEGMHHCHRGYGRPWHWPANVSHLFIYFACSNCPMLLQSLKKLLKRFSPVAKSFLL